MLVILKKLDKFKAICKCQQCNKDYTVNNFYDARKSPCGDICDDCKNVLNNATQLTQTLLQKVLDYNPLTGDVLYKVKTLRKQAGEKVGHKHIGGYLTISFGKNNRMLLHRLIYLYQTGCLPDQVDHINHDRLDNRWSNLRAANNTLNSKNCSISKNSVTKINGISYIPSLNKYRAYINVDHKQIHLGVFTDIADAAQARQQADIQYDFHANHGK